MKEASILVATLLLLLSCGNKKKKPEIKFSVPQAASQEKMADTCDEKVKSLEIWMRELSHSSVEASADVVARNTPDLVVTSKKINDEPKESISLRIDSKVILVEGSPVAQVRDGIIVDAGTSLLPFIEAVWSEYKKKPKTNTAGINLFVSQSTPWSLLVQTLNILSKSSVNEVQILFLGPAPKTMSPPPPSSVSKEIAAIRAKAFKPFDPSQRLRTLNKVTQHDGSQSQSHFMDPILTNCPGIKKSYEESASADPSNRNETFIVSMLQAVKDCECKVEIPALQEYWYLFGPLKIGKLLALNISLAVAGDKDALVLKANGASIWQEEYEDIINAVLKVESKTRILFLVDDTK